MYTMYTSIINSRMDTQYTTIYTKYTSIRNSRVDTQYWVPDSLTTPLTDSSGGFVVRFDTTHNTQSTHTTHTQSYILKVKKWRSLFMSPQKFAT